MSDRIAFFSLFQRNAIAPFILPSLQFLLPFLILIAFSFFCNVFSA
ncbi:MAG: hypothetical protein AAFY72_09810 [Cyanobacteria bacterium J06649_4]